MRATLLVITALAGSASADRAGLTLGIDGGFASTNFKFSEGSARRSRSGVCPPAVQLGAFVSDKLAIVGRVTCSGIRSSDDSGNRYRVWFYGAVLHAQYAPHPKVFIGPSAGLGYQIELGTHVETTTNAGWMLGGRAGWSFGRIGDGDAQLSIEILRSGYGDGFYLDPFSIAVHVGWQSD